MTGRPDGGARPEPVACRDAMGLKGSAHWVSARMSAAPPQRAAEADAGAVSPAAGANDELIAEIEELRKELIDAAREERAGAAVPHPLSDSAPPDERRVANLPAIIVPSPVDVPERAFFGAVLGWSAMAFAAVAAIAVLTLSGAPRIPSPMETAAQRPETARAPLLRAGEGLPRFTFFVTGAQPEQSAAPVAPGIVVATGTSPVAASGPADLDPLERVTVRGLPDGVRLSVAHRISATDWSIAPADLDEVRLVVPYDQAGPVRADVEFASRAGVVLARIGLAIEHEPPPVALVAVDGARGEAEPVADAEALAPVGAAPALAMTASGPAAVPLAPFAAQEIPVAMLPAEVPRESEVEAEAVAAAETLEPAGTAPALSVTAWVPAAAMPPAPFAAHEIPVTTLPEPRERRAKALARKADARARAAKPRSAASVPRPAMPPPRGLFPLEPAKSTKPAKAATETVAKTKAEPTAPAVAAKAAASEPTPKPKPKQKLTAATALPTGHQIQSTLGGGYSVAAP